MRANDLKRLILEGDEEDLTPDLLREIEAYPECRELLARTRTVRALIGLKRYEQPTLGAELRCRRAIIRTLRLGDEDASREWSPFMAPALRYAGAALLLLLVASPLYITTPRTSDTPVAEELEEIAVPALLEAEREVPVKPVLVATTNISGEGLGQAVAISRPAISNPGPARATFGPGPSVPVSYEP